MTDPEESEDPAEMDDPSKPGTTIDKTIGMAGNGAKPQPYKKKDDPVSYTLRLKEYKRFAEFSKWLLGGIAGLWAFSYDKFNCACLKWEMIIALVGIFCFVTTWIEYQNQAEAIEAFIEEDPAPPQRLKESADSWPGRPTAFFTTGLFCIASYALLIFIVNDLICPKEKKDAEHGTIIVNNQTIDSSSTIPLPPDTINPVKLNNILFYHDSSSLKKESYPELNRLVSMLNKFPEIRIEIRAHTDTDGSSDYNFGLSNRRAKSVVDYLSTQHIPRNRFTWKGLGEIDSIATNSTEEGKQLNRRVEFRRLN